MIGGGRWWWWWWCTFGNRCRRRRRIDVVRMTLADAQRWSDIDIGRAIGCRSFLFRLFFFFSVRASSMTTRAAFHVRRSPFFVFPLFLLLYLSTAPSAMLLKYFFRFVVLTRSCIRAIVSLGCRAPCRRGKGGRDEERTVFSSSYAARCGRREVK